MADATLNPTDDLVSLFSQYAEPITFRPPAFVAVHTGPEKWCTSCRRHQPRTSFPRHRAGKDGLSSRCSECTKVYKAKLRKRPHVKLYNAIRHRKSTYGLTHEQYEAMLVAQGGQCAICRQAFKSTRLTHVDHCHATGKVRGLLCIRCNHDVALVENEAKMAAMRAYIQTHKG